MTKPNSTLENTLAGVRKLIPSSLFQKAQPIYHYSLAFLSAIRYGFPSRNLTVIAVTGTKGKSTTTEMVNAIFEKAGYKTALSNTIRFKIGEISEPNMYKMSLPGRGFIQKFMRDAHEAGCTHLILEITSQAVLLSRHRYIDLNALIFTNISPEHIEAHGSFENYLEAKLQIADLLRNSKKKDRVIVVNGDDEHGTDFIKRARIENALEFKLLDATPYTTDENGSQFTFRGETINSKLPGEFNIQNMLSACVLSEEYGISLDAIKGGLEELTSIRGRVENVNESGDFGVYVDYAHTADSLEKLYKAFEGKRIIAVLGNTGGGRDTWKRPVMAGIAEKYADVVILTNEDPYDEDPMKILEEMANGVKDKSKLIVHLDRREAIALALSKARPGNVVLITGKGTDPYIMLADNKKLPWDDATVARQELEKLVG